MCTAKDEYLITDLHCIIQRMPACVHQEEPRSGGDANRQAVPAGPLKVPATQQALPLEVSFEQIMEQLGADPNCHVEPDGWFLWTGYLESHFWRLNGQLTDDGQRLLFVELRGECPASCFRQLKTMLAAGLAAGNECRLMIQLPAKGLFVDEVTFEALARS